MEKTIEDNAKEKVALWNSHYANIGRELKDLRPRAYEIVVADELLSICDGDVELALAVFRHPQNQGGWMSGNVEGNLQSRVS